MLLFFRVLLFLIPLALVDCADSVATSPAHGTADVEEDGKHQQDDVQVQEENSLSDDHMRQVHAEWDVNGDKTASLNELLNFTEAHHRDVALQEVSVEEVIKEKDTSKDGLVSLEEHLHDATFSENEADEATRKTKIQDETDLFNAADTNKDGVLDKNEIQGLVFPELHEGTTNVLTKMSLRDADEDGNGKISLAEFKESDLPENSKAEDASTEEGALEEDNAQAEALFKRLDVNGDGSLDQDELRPVKNGSIARENMVKEVIADLDKDGNQSIDPTELVQGKNLVYDSDLQSYLLAWARRRQLPGAR